MMDETTYQELAESVLSAISDALEEADTAGALDIENNNGIVNIVDEAGKTFVLNRHAASRQIWLSSPISGASHFNYVTDQDEWIDSKGRELFTLLAEDIAAVANIKVEF